MSNNDALEADTSGSNGTAIDVRGLSHTFKNHRALAGVSFQVNRQELHGFVGPNGAGKTTTLKLICTLLRPQSGRVRVFQHDVVREVNQIRKRIGFMPDHFSMYRQMTVFEYLDFFGAAYGFRLSERNRIIKDVLELTDMDGRKDDLISGLSRGMQQRVSLARVLVNDPDLLLLDEPASGLDPRARIELMEILRELRRMGKTIFISSHILSELAELCDSVTIIDRGRVKYSGAMKELLSRTDEHPVYKLTLGVESETAADKLRAVHGVTDVEATEVPTEFLISYDWTETDTNALLAALLELGMPIVGFSEDRKHLNQAFMDLTERGVR
ncbi:MAG: ABC transporter ATP-binding protein [Planctomycetaceae bacterium]|jgi:ABC-2 type transport system ATP-binding protein|nr:ABC transporter ATP-binding protein [Planctomycetaceae bacterium]MBT6156477.1 ABC transporter ATP-binding protein [Planctomycetaceae bacterium]MBT6485445.1 ABC transporter ATP-binding protein [Planctomycetaceae bacterium]MBT6497241.1 ABC transporter ATP-binding protein [Planctomycetaceae bacterium]